MKIDFHSHAKMTKRICFSLEYTEYLFREISNCGLDAICLTEHFNSIEFNKVYKYISNKYDNIGDHFLVNGIKVFTGMEIDIKEGGHILIIGNINSILDINFKLKNNKEKNNFIVFKDLLNLLSPYNLIVGAAHPFRKKSNIPSINIDLLSKLDFIDFNGTDYVINSTNDTNKLETLANKLKLNLLAGSDSHLPLQFGSIWNDFYNNCNTINELKYSIKNKLYTIYIDKNIEIKVKTSKLLKKSLKEINNLGGNYLSIFL
jgi:histidinol phosphatase-like PHP family hydrolase